MVTGYYGPHGSLEMCLAVRDGGFRHLYADVTDPGNLGASGELRAWNTSGMRIHLSASRFLPLLRRRGNQCKLFHPERGR